ncbi:MAG: acetyltransferase [Bacteroidia bacterium]|nr:acetyltransferase [Bacteroidia bacterium]
MKRAAFIGFGDFGQQIFSLAETVLQPEEVIVFDDIQASKPDTGTIKAFPFMEYSRPEFRDYDFFVCLGYKHLKLKQKIIQELTEKGYSLPALIHPTCYVSPMAHIGSAVYMYPMCNVDKNTVIGSGTLLNNSVTVSHDTKVGEVCYLCPGVTTAGFIDIGDRTFIGSGSVIANGVNIGADTIVGVGSVITKSVPPGASVIGNPMRILSKPLMLT